MKIVTRFISDDGTEHHNETSCLKHDLLIVWVEKEMTQLGEKLNDANFQAGDGYIQHSVRTVLNVRASICKKAQEYSDHHWLQSTIDKGFGVDVGWAGRIISEIGGPLYKAWGRISCIDCYGREWGQMFFCINTDKAKIHCIKLSS